MRACYAIVISLGILLASFCPSLAQCPSKAYFRIDAQSPIGGFDATLSSTVCVSIVTSQARIAMKSLITAEVLNTAKLEEALIERFAGAAPCGIFSAGGWDLSGASVSFLGSSSSARIQVVAVAKPCQSAGGTRITYQVPLIVSYANAVVSLRLDGSNATIGFGQRGFSIPFLAGFITGKLNAVLADRTLDTTPYIPSYVRELNPVISQPSLVLQSHRLTLKINVAGELTKPVADRLLSDSAKSVVVPSIIRWFGSSAPTS